MLLMEHELNTKWDYKKWMDAGIFMVQLKSPDFKAWE